jgi:hypothetical protein
MLVRQVAVIVLVALIVLAAGCGEDKSAQTVTPSPPPASTTQPGSPPTATETVSKTPPAPSEPPAPQPPAATTGTPPSETSPGAGDEEGNKVPARLDVAAKQFNPQILEVPAFLRVELTVASVDGRPHLVRIALPKGPLDIRVPPGGRRRVTLPGLQPGDYLVAADGAAPGARIRAKSGG